MSAEISETAGQRCVVVLKTERDGRVVQRVAVVENAAQLQREFVGLDDLVENFFKYIGRHFISCLPCEDEGIDTFVRSRLSDTLLRGDELVARVRIAQVLSRMLDAYSVLPVFYTDEDAERAVYDLVAFSDDPKPHLDPYAVDMSTVATCSYRPEPEHAARDRRVEQRIASGGPILSDEEASDGWMINPDCV